MKGIPQWLTDAALKLVAPRLIAGLLLGLTAGLAAAGLLSPEVAACLQGAL